jgi:GDPmannose 4,6-dehydratase
MATAAIALGKQDCLYLGNLDALRDWGHAKDYVKAMWLMLQQDKPEDFIIATGKTTKVRDFVQMAFAHVGFTLRWEGEGVEEVGILDSIDTEKYFEATGVTLSGVEGLNVKSSGLRASTERSRSVKEADINSEPESHNLTLNKLTINLPTLNLGSTLVKVDPSYFRPTEVDLLLGDPTKSKTQLGWEPQYDLAGLVEDMMKGDLELSFKIR